MIVVDLPSGSSRQIPGSPAAPCDRRLSPTARAHVAYGRRFAIVDLTANAAIKHSASGQAVGHRGRSPNGRRVYVVNRAQQVGVVVDAGDLRVARTVTLRRPVATLSCSSGGSRALIAPGQRSRKAIVLDTTRPPAQAHLGGAGPGYVALSAHRRAHLLRERRQRHDHVRERLQPPAPPRPRARRPAARRDGRAAGLLAAPRHRRGRTASRATAARPDPRPRDDDTLNGFRGYDIVEGGEGNDIADRRDRQRPARRRARRRQAVRRVRPRPHGGRRRERLHDRRQLQRRPRGRRRQRLHRPGDADDRAVGGDGDDQIDRVRPRARPARGRPGNDHIDGGRAGDRIDGGPATTR